MTNLQSVPTTASQVTDFHRRQFHNYRLGMDLLLHQKGFRAPNIALLGFRGHGKSTFLNTVGKCLVDNQNLVTAAPGDDDVTHKMKFVDIQEEMPPQKTLLRMLDTYGVKIGRYDQETIDTIKEGCGSGLVLNERPKRDAEPDPADRINAYIIVVSCSGNDDGLAEKIKSIIHSLGDGKETPSNFVVVLTKVDMKVPEEYAKEWDSPDCEETQELKREWARKLQVQENRVYAMSNFTEKPKEEERIYTAGKVYDLLYDTLQICKKELQRLPDVGNDSVNDRRTAFSVGRAIFKKTEDGAIVKA